MLNRSDMLFLRRWTLFLVLTATALIIIITFKDRTIPFSKGHLRSSVSEQCPNRPPSPPLELPKSNGFDWRNVGLKNPVQSLIALPTGKPKTLPKVQFSGMKPLTGQKASEQRQRREVVKQVFQRSWNSYRKKAYLHDELAPISGGFKDTFGGWGATLVDSLDTLWIMDLKAEFEDAVAAADDLTFSPDTSSLQTISMFETTIRYLGGFLAAYDLTDCKDMRLLQKAVQVGDMIYASYDTPNRMPVTRWNIRDYNKQQLPTEDGVLAELATASLEFTRLSQLTGDMKYYDAIARITNLLDTQQNRTLLPGMFPTALRTRAQDLTSGAEFGFGALADSAFEYMGKAWQLLNGLEPQYQKLYEGAMGVASSHLLYRPSIPDQADVLFSARYNTGSQRRDAELQHLACFAGGMYLLGGRLFANESHIDIGRRLTDGCVWAYKHAPLGIMPEILQMKPCPDLSPCPYKETQQSPFVVVGDPRYLLRPEAIESVFYAWRITRDEKYQDIAWQMFQSIEHHTRTEFGNAAIKDVMVQNVEHEDSMESFWMAETLKYFYLVFSDFEVMSLDEWVFNTEAHPFRLPVG